MKWGTRVQSTPICRLFFVLLFHSWRACSTAMFAAKFLEFVEQPLSLLPSWIQPFSLKILVWDGMGKFTVYTFSSHIPIAIAGFFGCSFPKNLADVDLSPYVCNRTLAWSVFLLLVKSLTYWLNPDFFLIGSLAIASASISIFTVAVPFLADKNRLIDISTQTWENPVFDWVKRRCINGVL